MPRRSLLCHALCVTVLGVACLTAPTPPRSNKTEHRPPPANTSALPTLNEGERAREIPAGITTAAAVEPDANTIVRAEYGKLPLRFEPHVGQTDARVKCLARGGGYTLFLTNTEAV